MMTLLKLFARRMILPAMILTLSGNYILQAAEAGAAESSKPVSYEPGYQKTGITGQQDTLAKDTGI